MTISEQSEVFFGKKIIAYKAGEPIDNDPSLVYRIAQEYDDDLKLQELLTEFLTKVDKSQLQALVIGMWDEPFDEGPAAALQLLIDQAEHLPQFKALFVGDMTYEECEISWIIQTDYSPVLQAFPKLQALRIRGSNSLVIPPLKLPELQELIIECGGMPAAVLHSLAQSELPALSHLELWIGTEEYGFDGSLDDVIAAVQKLQTPSLRYLGLRDAEIADAIAVWLSSQDWLGQLQTLDLSLGTLGDDGARALMASEHLDTLRNLPKLDLSHHFITEAVQTQLRQVLPNAVLDDAQDPDDDYRFVAVGE